MTFEIQFPVRDPHELLTYRTINELPDHLDDPDDRAITREVLELFREAAGGKSCSIGQCDQVLADLTTDERRALLDICRKRTGLPSHDEAEQMRARAWAEANPRRWPLELRMTESGALIDAHEADADAASEQARQRSLAARRKAQRDERAIEAAATAEHQRALAEQARRETPIGIPVP